MNDLNDHNLSMGKHAFKIHFTANIKKVYVTLHSTLS